MLYGIKMKV